MSVIVLKVDVDTLRGTREGLPNLLRLFAKAQARATFLFSLGPDHTGWAMRRAFRPGFLRKVSRTLVLEHYGLKTLMYGLLLPGPDIGRHAQAQMRAACDAGFEVGIHAWDHVVWQDNVRRRDRAWTLEQMNRAHARFIDVFGAPPGVHGAAGWQMNTHAFEQVDAWDMAYASDGRGRGPYRPMVGGRALRHVQIPTTLPTLDEVLGTDGIDRDNVAAHLLRLTEGDAADHVFTLHAELEGQKLASVLVELLDGWRKQGHGLISLADYHARLDLNALPCLPIEWGQVAGRAGELIVQPA